MYCPKCSRLQASNEVKFCPHCGLPLGNVKAILIDGSSQAGQSKGHKLLLWARQKGVRQGILLMLLSIALVPAHILLGALFPANDRLVEGSVSDTAFDKISHAVLITMFLLGLVRLLYARFFQQDAGEGESGITPLTPSASDYALPPAQSIPASTFGSWRSDTGEVAPTGRMKDER